MALLYIAQLCPVSLRRGWWRFQTLRVGSACRTGGPWEAGRPWASARPSCLTLGPWDRHRGRGQAEGTRAQAGGAGAAPSPSPSHLAAQAAVQVARCAEAWARSGDRALASCLRSARPPGGSAVVTVPILQLGTQAAERGQPLKATESHWGRACARSRVTRRPARGRSPSDTGGVRLLSRRQEKNEVRSEAAVAPGASLCGDNPRCQTPWAPLGARSPPRRGASGPGQPSLGPWCQQRHKRAPPSAIQHPSCSRPHLAGADVTGTGPRFRECRWGPGPRGHRLCSWEVARRQGHCPDAGLDRAGHWHPGVG